MAFFKIKKGLDIPLDGSPSGDIKEFFSPKSVGLDLTPFNDTKLKLLVKVGDIIKIGQPLVEDKNCEKKVFVSPGAGKIKAINRGKNRCLTSIEIDLAAREDYQKYDYLNPTTSTRNELIKRFLIGGAFSHIRSRPFNILANPSDVPRSIFIKAIESAPFVPPPEMQILGFEDEFQVGLEAMQKLTDGDVHLVYRPKSVFDSFQEKKNIRKHCFEGPHPAANQSLHICNLDPIRNDTDVIWTLSAHDVVIVGSLLMGKYHKERIISIAGNGFIKNKSGFFSTRMGMPIFDLIKNRCLNYPLHLISGDPLTGEIRQDGFLGFSHFVLSAILEVKKRKFLNFLRFVTSAFTTSKTYISGKNEFSTCQHGEERAFIDGAIYDKVMPMNISAMHLVKSLIANDYEKATNLGLLEVDSEDFSLPAFVCPSKIDMVGIVKQGLRSYRDEYL